MASRRTPAGWRRRAVLGLAVGAAGALAGCGGGGLSASGTPPPAAFEVRVIAEDAVDLRYTGIGSQSTARFRVVLEGGGADGTYGLEAVAGDATWSADERVRLDRETLGLEAPLRVDGLTVELQYDDDGAWRTLLRETLSA